MVLFLEKLQLIISQVVSFKYFFRRKVIDFNESFSALNEPEEREKLTRSLGPNSKVLLLTNHGGLCGGETIEEAFYHVQHLVKAAEAQLNLLPAGLDNLIPISEETRKAIYDASRKPPDGTVVQPPTQLDNKEKITHHVRTAHQCQQTSNLIQNIFY
jgi:hypothetical protein